MASERQLLGADDRWWGEHVHRYHEALQYINNSDSVLDIACGTGFGTAIIANHSSGKVVGGDIAEEAIRECRTQWQKENIEFKVLDGTRLDFPDNYFDKIVSFETIEHTTQYRKMLSEFARVLKHNGKLILSTPNSQITSPDGVIENPFHTQEFNYEELKDILGSSFSVVTLAGQRNKRYDSNSLKMGMGRIFEKLFLSFGIRKLPYSWRNGLMKALFGYPLYATDKDFVLETNPSRIKEDCPVLFAVCQK